MVDVKYKKKGCRISDRHGRFELQYWCPKEKKSIGRGSKDFIVLENIANKIDFDIFSKNPHLLPKGISILTQSKKFALSILDPNKISYTKRIGLYKTVQQATLARLKVIKSLIDI
ncbi:MAG: hypothetical protein GY775_16625 [Candidatus Scalindua sp.]|nr:hypothetical protein [Candidatus Scalindua sp.]